MVLTRKQEDGLKVALQRYSEGEKYTVISGYAGTGKSTLVKFIIAALSSCGIDIDTEVCFATFTGKAAQVLSKKGNKNVSTLHKLLYQAVLDKNTGEFFFVPKQAIDYSIVVVDEVSMAPKNFMELLFQKAQYVICLGDPFQLPPIDKNSDNHLLDNPHVFLDEIMRQAEDSEIIRLSMMIREGRPIEDFKGKEVIVTKDFDYGMLPWADQVLCATNAKRISLNTDLRKILGKGPLPEKGDKVICLRNYWETISDGAPLVNGTIGFLGDIKSSVYRYPFFFKKPNLDIFTGSFISETGEEYNGLGFDKSSLINNKLGYSLKDFQKMKSKPCLKLNGDMIPLEFAYGYAITTHKAQGSEWNKVLVLEEKFPFDREEHAKWLYTSVTRASEKLVLVRG